MHDAPNLIRRIHEASPQWVRESYWLAAGMRGSHAHGTFLPPEHEHGIDDVDVFVVTIQPPSVYAGLHPDRHDCFETAGDDLDILVYDARKWLRLLEKQNPNSHAWLWTDAVFYQTPVWADLVKARSTMIDAGMFSHLIGYADGQLKLMQRGGTKTRYMGEKREKLMARYGYDIKNAAHCIRLLLMARHLATSGKLLVQLPADEVEIVRAVKRGERDLRWIQDYSAGLLAQVRKMEESAALIERVPEGVFDALWAHVLTWEAMRDRTDSPERLRALGLAE